MPYGRATCQDPRVIGQDQLRHLETQHDRPCVRVDLGPIRVSFARTRQTSRRLSVLEVSGWKWRIRVCWRRHITGCCHPVVNRRRSILIVYIKDVLSTDATAYPSSAALRALIQTSYWVPTRALSIPHHILPILDPFRLNLRSLIPQFDSPASIFSFVTSVSIDFLR